MSRKVKVIPKVITMTLDQGKRHVKRIGLSLVYDEKAEYPWSLKDGKRVVAMSRDWTDLVELVVRRPVMKKEE